MLKSDSTKPIYVQIAEWLENEIIKDHIKTDEKVYSQYQLAEIFNINPATAAKGLNMLADDGVLYKKRGLGMFVTKEGKAIILEKRKNQTLKGLIKDLVQECRSLNVSKDEIVQLIQSEFDKGGDQ